MKQLSDEDLPAGDRRPHEDKPYRDGMTMPETEFSAARHGSRDMDGCERVASN